MTIGLQCRAARALAEITRGKLSLRSGIHEAVIRDFEHNLDKPDEKSIAALQSVLEELGAVFIEENDGGIGVRRKFTVSEAKRIARMEGEGGLSQTTGCRDLPDADAYSPSRPESSVPRGGFIASGLPPHGRDVAKGIAVASRGLRSRRGLRPTTSRGEGIPDSQAGEAVGWIARAQKKSFPALARP